mmetsp:Transcript_7741/g.16996  ORF Transcript_7741/g.16996 Transcript_7741/m.16996 type:complete len:148 (-) Transcript_7741:114-557(-)|eukprot:CAMPEP_0178401112 /NCGR_PEP_ID=MMETSP0689_2-20121128/16135_1 /TAXON_ID=160604 /ORGANISM="Amphidinium massartii, Strain CS-259" /LENGTH=147 /DNA_ID=CAMNT_0020021925 /DNA_START=99 /DNA_END=542 /DNA_ORIENTATION=-
MAPGKEIGVPMASWTSAIYTAPDGNLAKPEASKLTAMKFDPAFWSQAYTRCIGNGHSHQECIASLPDDVRTTAPGPLASKGAEMTAAINSVTEGKSVDYDELAVLGGYKEEEVKTSMQKATDFSYKAGYKMMGVPFLLFALKFVKIR